jgi:hypothetical protein
MNEKFVYNNIVFIYSCKYLRFLVYKETLNKSPTQNLIIPFFCELNFFFNPNGPTYQRTMSKSDFTQN